MFTPLSVFTYFSRNIWKVLPVILILSLSSIATVSAAALTNSILKEFQFQLSLYQNYDTLTYNKDLVTNIDISKINNLVTTLPNLSKFYRGTSKPIRGQSIVGNGFFLTHFISAKDYQEFTKDMSWELAQGRLPSENTNEITLSSRLIKSKNLKIGDEVGSEVDKSEPLLGRYKVVGYFKESNSIGALANWEYLQATNPLSTSSTSTYFLKAKAGEREPLEQELNQLRSQYPGLIIDTKSSIQKEIDQNIQVIKQIADAVTILIVIVITFSAGLLNMIFFNQRLKEFALLQGIGYSRKFILTKTLSESFLLTAISIVFSLGLNTVIYFLINSIIYSPRGIVGLNLFENNTALYILPIPLTVFATSVITIWSQLEKQNAVVILENRT